MNFANHPCFNTKVRHTTGRIHLPVAPRCNIQCNFCNRKFDCVNESRPGVTSSILSPGQALLYLEEALEKVPNIAVMGIAGPGDPFANPEETLETLRLVRARYPDMILCVASNGLNVSPYVDDLAKVGLSHITITVNAVDSQIGAKIYAWVRHNKRVRAGTDGAQQLLENQLAAIKALKARGLTVKVNCVVLPGINDTHVQDLAQRMAELKVDILNCIPYYPTEGAALANLSQPTSKQMALIRRNARQYLPQMAHCARCRADAVGLLGAQQDPTLVAQLMACATQPITSSPVTDTATPATPPSSNDRPYVAVASMEGMLINQHLGEADVLYIYENTAKGIRLHETRTTPEPGGGTARWEALSALLHDCRTLLVSGIGPSPRHVLEGNGLKVIVLSGVITDAVQGLYAGQSLAHLMKRPAPCGVECSGQGNGCG
jgi:nitrogen fixation protein NifB